MAKFFKTHKEFTDYLGGVGYTPTGEGRIKTERGETFQSTPYGIEEIIVPAATPIATIRQPRDIQTELSTYQTTEQERIRKQREDLNTQLQSRLAEIDRLAMERKERIRELGRREEAEAGAISLRAGLAGSEFGKAYTTKAKQRTEELLGAEEQKTQYERDQARGLVNQAVFNLEERASKVNWDILSKNIDLYEKEQSKARTDISNLSKSGQMTWEQIKADTTTLEELKKQTGMNDIGLEIFYKSNSPEIKGFTTKIENGYAVALWYDPATKKMEMKKEKLDIPAEKEIKSSTYISETAEWQILYTDGTYETKKSGTTVPKAPELKGGAEIGFYEQTYNPKIGKWEYKKVIGGLPKEGEGIIPSLNLENYENYKNAFKSASISLPVKTQKNATEQFNQLIASKDINGIKEYLVRISTAGSPVDQQNQAFARLVAIETLNDIQNLLDEAQKKGTPTNILSGNLENVAQKMGTSSNTDFAYIGNQIAQAIQIYRRGMSGVAFTPVESKEYKSIFPSYTNVEKLNIEKINSLKDSFNRQQRTFLGMSMGTSNYDRIFGNKQPSKKLQQNQVIPIGKQSQTSGGLKFTRVK